MSKYNKCATINQQYIPSYFKLDVVPKADPQAIVMAENVRFTVITNRLIRMEYSPINEFEDCASQAFWYRKQPVPYYEVKQNEKKLEIITDYLHLHYSFNDLGFDKTSLYIELKETGKIWHYGDESKGNLKGTARTLDNTNGKIDLEEGLMSKDGWALIDDSHTLIFDEKGWLYPRFSETEKVIAYQTKDLYFFGYGHEYTKCLKDYCKITGKAPLMPRWALGNWWSRYWKYTQKELTELMKEFEKREIPLSVCIVDMDWHICENEYNNGWTGYTWNRELFPAPKEFIDFLHNKGLKTALNLHPADGVWPHEEMYGPMAEFMGIDPESNQPVKFDIADPRFVRGYFEKLHHPLEEQGVDFWWMDWQQGKKTAVEGLDPLWWLNHIHYLDLQRDKKTRPFIFSRWGGLGNHRYPIGFSGDTHVTWESLALQPSFTSTAANVGYGWWSHDIGGHFFGIEDGEIYTRWVQFGVFSPIFRLHSSLNPYQERRPWGYDRQVYGIVKDMMQLRHALIPYIYSMAWRNHVQSIPLITPMYYGNPDEEIAYKCPNQYYYGTELLVAPYTSPIDEHTRLSRQTIWLPEGEWYNFFTGEAYKGNTTYAIYGTLEDIPVFAKAGAIVPLAKKTSWGGIDNPENIELYIFAGNNNSFELYEDDGETLGYTEGHSCITKFTQKWNSNNLEFILDAAVGDFSVIPQQREYKAIFVGVSIPEQVVIRLNGDIINVDWEYDQFREMLMLNSLSAKPSDCISIVLSSKEKQLLSKIDRTEEKYHEIVKVFRIAYFNSLTLYSERLEYIQKPEKIIEACGWLTASQMRALIEVISKKVL